MRLARISCRLSRAGNRLQDAELAQVQHGSAFVSHGGRSARAACRQQAGSRNPAAAGCGIEHSRSLVDDRNRRHFAGNSTTAGCYKFRPLPYTTCVRVDQCNFAHQPARHSTSQLDYNRDRRAARAAWNSDARSPKVARTKLLDADYPPRTRFSFHLDPFRIRTTPAGVGISEKGKSILGDLV